MPISGRAASAKMSVTSSTAGSGGDLVDEADVLVFARHDPRDDLAPGDFGIDNGLAAAAAVIDHHDKYCMLAIWLPPGYLNRRQLLFRKNGN